MKYDQYSGQSRRINQPKKKGWDMEVNMEKVPHKLLDTIMERRGLKNDAALARELEVAPPCISKIRRGKLPVGATLILRAHEALGFEVKEIRQLLAA